MSTSAPSVRASTFKRWASRRKKIFRRLVRKSGPRSMAKSQVKLKKPKKRSKKSPANQGFSMLVIAFLRSARPVVAHSGLEDLSGVIASIKATS
jgi:hypothetical protein